LHDSIPLLISYFSVKIAFILPKKVSEV